MKLRKITPSDVPALQKFFLDILIDEYGAEKKPRPDIDDMERFYDGEKNIRWVWEEDGKIGGSVGLQKINEECCFLRRMFLAQEKRGQGNGQKLFQFFVDEAKKRGYQKAYWGTIFPFTQAQRFYAQCGVKKLSEYPPEIAKATSQSDDLFYEYLL